MKIKKKISKSISYIRKTDTVIFGVVFILLIILIMGISISVELYKQTQLIRVQETMDVISDSHKQRFEGYVNQKVEVLQGLASFTEINTMIHQKQSDFIKGRSDELGFHHLFVMDMAGYGHYFDDGVIKDQSEEIFFHDVMSHHVYITQPFYAEYTAYMTVCTSIFDTSKKKVGVLCGAIELKNLQSEFSESKAAYDGQMYLVDRNGRYISCSDMEKVYNQLKIYKEADSELTLVKEAFIEKRDKKGTVVLKGTEYLTNVTYLADYDWAIIQCVNKSDVYGELRTVETFKYASLIIAVVIVVCVVRIGMYLSKSQKRINTDTLTGCNSRAAMERLLDNLERITDVNITIVYMDLNKFKYINDTYGHDKGDEILCIFTNVLKGAFDKKGIVGRMGGDEFMIVFVNTSDEEVEKLCIQVKEQLIEESKKLSIDYTISASYGYATRPRGSNKLLDSVIVEADEKMYRYKEEDR